MENNGHILKYTPTQNRDLMKMIERINRSSEHRDSSALIISAIEKTMWKHSEETLKELWNSVDDKPFMVPMGVSVTFDIVPPSIRRTKTDDSNDGQLYYSMPIKAMVKIQCPDGMKPSDETFVGEWYMRKVSLGFDVKMTEFIKEELSSMTYGELFSFSSAEKYSELVKDATAFEPKKINIMVPSVFKFKRDEDSDGVSRKLIDGDAMAEELISSLSLAIERIKNG